MSKIKRSKTEPQYCIDYYFKYGLPIAYQLAAIDNSKKDIIHDAEIHLKRKKVTHQSKTTTPQCCTSAQLTDYSQHFFYVPPTPPLSTAPAYTLTDTQLLYTEPNNEQFIQIDPSVQTEETVLYTIPTTLTY